MSSNVYNYKQIINSYIINHCNNLILDLDWNAAEIDSWNNAFRQKNFIQCDLINFYGISNLNFMFYVCNNLKQSNVTNWNISNVQSLSYLFSGCYNLINLNVTNWNIDNVQSLSRTFQNCNNLTTLDVSNWNISKVYTLGETFQSCGNLTTLNVSNWNTSNVNIMTATFAYCNNLTTLDVSNWNTSKVYTMAHMFSHPTWTTSYFGGCSNLINLDVTNWNMDNVENIGSIFSGCSNLKNLNVSKWNTAKIYNFFGAFGGCSNLTNLDVSNWNMNNAKYLNGMFKNCNNLTTLNIFNWKTNNVISLRDIFSNCSNLTNLNISNWNISTVNDLSNMLYNCVKYNGELNLAEWNTSNVQNMSNTFRGLGSHLNNYCDAFDPNNCVYLDIANWTYDNVTNLSHFLCNITSPGESALYTLFGVDENYEIHWNTGKVTNMSYAFSFCPSLFCDSGVRWEWGQEVEWYLNTDNVTDLSGAFFNAGYCADGYYGPYSDCWGGCHLNVYLSDVSKVINAAYCFTSNQPFDPWNVSPGGTHSGWWCAGSIFDISQCPVLNFYNVTNATHLFYNYETYGQTMPKIIFHEVENLNNAFAYSYDIGSYDIINWSLYKAKDISRMFTGTSGMNNEILQDFATILVNASQVTYKNLYNNNVYSPIYSSSLHINSNTIGTNLIQQLRSGGWTTENEQWTMTVQYYFSNGTQIQSASTYIYDYQENYNIQIPDLIQWGGRNYPLMTANQFNGAMPARNVTFTAIYNDGTK